MLALGVIIEPGIMLDASHPSVRQWAAVRPKTTCTDLTTVDTEALVTAFADLCAWTHHDWSPVTNTEKLMPVSRQEICEVDRALSIGAWVNDRLAALALASGAAVLLWALLAGAAVNRTETVS